VTTRRALAALAGLALATAGGAPRAEDGKDPKAPAKLRIALDRLRPAGVTPAFAAAVEERVCAALAELPALDVVCPSDLAAAAVLAKNAAVFGECASDDCMKRLDEVKAADRRVSGAVERGGKGLVLSLQVTGPDGPGPRVAERLPEDLDAILAKVPGLVKKLFP
jgi:hypothetical protein